MAQQGHCVVRGSINLDEYYYVSHISRPGETISSTGFDQRMGGKGFNQAVAVSLATGGGENGRVSFYGTVGNDDAGKGLKEKLSIRWGLNNDSLVIDSEKNTGRAIIQVAKDGENSIVLFPGANHSEILETTDSKPWPKETTHLLLQNEISLRSTLKAIERAENIITILNPSPMLKKEEIQQFPWEKVDWLVVNQIEAGILFTSLTGINPPEDIQILLKELGIHTALIKTRIICTLGAKGVIASLPGLPLVQVPAAAVNGPVVDTTGAGDTFAGYFVAELLSLGRQSVGEEEVEQMLRVATRAAAMCVERAGTVDSMPMASEVERRFGICRK